MQEVPEGSLVSIVYVDDASPATSTSGLAQKVISQQVSVGINMQQLYDDYVTRALQMAPLLDPFYDDSRREAFKNRNKIVSLQYTK